MNLGLRNWLAARCLEALADDRAEPALRALAAFAARADDTGSAAEMPDEDARTLLRWPKIFIATPFGVRLAAAMVGDLPSLRWRAERFAEALDAWRSGRPRSPAAPSGMPPSADEVRWMVAAGAALFNARLFFEVHERLEPGWRRADGPLRLFLQGLIQVAAGLHHEQNGNRRGAIALLAEGSGKLRRFGTEAYGVELGEFLPRIADLARGLTVAGDAADADVPRLVLRPRAAARAAQAPGSSR
jgi:uncharacterized protein